MNIDVEFLNMEAKAAHTGVVPPELCSHATFLALNEHDLALGRPALTAEAFLDGTGSWSLARLKNQLEQIDSMLLWLEQERESIEQALHTRQARYTAAPIPAQLRYVLYAGGADGGFAPDSEAVYLNMTLYTRRDTFMDTLSHECYHAREKEQYALDRRGAFADRGPLQRILAAAAEEGIATLVQFDGMLENDHAAKRYRSASEGAAQLSQLLAQYASGELVGTELEHAFFSSDCCYSAGLYVACGIWNRFGIEGLELWSRDGSLDEYMRRFMDCPEAAQWTPEVLDLLKYGV